jgi:serine/threonine-protein kinase RsbW
MITKEYKCQSCTFEELVKVRDFVKEQSISLGAEEMIAENIALAVDEAVTNLIEHGFKTKDNSFILEITKDNTDLIIDILDDGISFDPKKIEDPDLEKYFKELKKGGLGIYIIKSMMDSIEYLPLNKHQKYNILRLKKSL